MNTASSAALGSSGASWARWKNASSALSPWQKVLAGLVGVSGVAVLGGLVLTAAAVTRKLWGPVAIAGLAFWAGTKACARAPETAPVQDRIHPAIPRDGMVPS